MVTDESTLAALDIEYQVAVQNNDAATMERLLADNFVLIVGNGAVYNKADLLQEARDEAVIYERQEATDRTVRCWGDTAVVTALLWIKGRQGDTPLHFKVWYSDTYARTATGWRYVLGQAGARLPAE